MHFPHAPRTQPGLTAAGLTDAIPCPPPRAADIALVCLHLRVWRLLSSARRRRAAKLAALGAVTGADVTLLSEPLIERDAPRSCEAGAADAGAGA